MVQREGSEQKKTCITDCEKRTKENWLSLCVGRRIDKFWSDELTCAQYVYNLFCESKRLVEKRRIIIFKSRLILKIYLI